MSIENIIKNNAQEYYTTGNQTLSDDVFDALVDNVRTNNPDSDVLTTGWGYKPGSDNKIKHRYCHIGSLQKVKTIEDFHSKMGYDGQYNVAAKLDGMSCVLYFENGKLIKALTRGDGEYGIDITEKLHYVKGFAYEIKDKSFTGAVRSEIFMTPIDYDKFKLKYPDAKNARNSAAGIMNSNVESVSPEDYGFLSLYVYTVVANESEFGPRHVYNLYSWLMQNFRCVAPFTQVAVCEAVLITLKEQWEKLVVLDGLVITQNNVAFNTETKNYNYNQIAWKFQDDIKIAKVKHIEWTLSKHNAYIPVVVFEQPIELEGTQVQRATGYNAKWIKDMGIMSGVYVAVRKANMIIPEIIEVINEV